MGELLKQIDFGQLVDPTETSKQREAFCSKVVVAKPIINELVKRMMREIAKIYFGKAQNNEILAYFNGMIAGLEELINQTALYESEHLDKQKKEEPIDYNIVSGSELGI